MMNSGRLSWWLVRHILYAGSSLVLVEALVRSVASGSIGDFGCETGPLEALHLGLQFGALVLFALAAKRARFGGEAFGLAAYAAALGLVRESDAYLDHALFRGAYKLPATLLGVLALRRAWRARGTIGAEITAWVRTPAFMLAAVGAFVVLGFAQVVGQKELWQALMGAGYDRSVKDAAEEMLELLGYLLIFFSAVETYGLARNSGVEETRAANDGVSSGASSAGSS